MSGYIDPFWDENRAERGDDELRLEQDILAPLSQSKRLFVYETKDFWRQIKSAGYPSPLIYSFMSSFDDSDFAAPPCQQMHYTCSRHFNLHPPTP